MHGGEVMDKLCDSDLFAPGDWSKEPTEALIRKFRKVRSSNARHSSRIDNNKDVMTKLWSFSTFS